MGQSTILVVGKPQKAEGISAAAHEKGIQFTQVETIEKAMDYLLANSVDMVFFDAGLELPDFFTALNGAHMTMPVVAVGPAQPVQNAVKAIRLGAIEYLSTPLDKELLNTLLDKFNRDDTDEPVHADPKTKELLAQARQFAASSATVLLRGESGTGKEVFSNFIHKHSDRKDKPFISINCAAIPESLLESELFGHEKGAFSGAVGKRIGRFQLADKGTLLLDEISEMDLLLQAKLLRAIQERVIDPVGSSSSVPVDIRLIATTNRDIEQQVAEGGFREDLYFRLNVVMLEIPPLRERKGDIEPLSKYFANMYGEQNGLSGVDISAKALEKLNGCYWKGNVRELENTIHRAVLMMGDKTVMEPDHITISPMSLKMAEQEEVSAEVRDSRLKAAAASRYQSASGMFESGSTGVKDAPVMGRTMEDVEREHILSTLGYCQGDREHAANVLGISIKKLRTKLKEYLEEEGSSKASAS
jgi:DNA-binding NtrC family response regulator